MRGNGRWAGIIFHRAGYDVIEIRVAEIALHIRWLSLRGFRCGSDAVAKPRLQGLAVQEFAMLCGIGSGRAQERIVKALSPRVQWLITEELELSFKAKGGRRPWVARGFFS